MRSCWGQELRRSLVGSLKTTHATRSRQTNLQQVMAMCRWFEPLNDTTDRPKRVRHGSSFVSTTPADPPLRRRRQRPAHLSSSFMEVQEIKRTASAPMISRPISMTRSCSTPSSSSPSPLDISPKHDSLRSPSSRKFLWTQTPRADSPLPSSPLARTPSQRHVFAECAPRTQSDGTVHQVAAGKKDTSEHATPTMRRSRSEPLSLFEAAEAQSPVEPAPSLRDVASGRPSNARFPMREPRVTMGDVAMLAWEHTKRLDLQRIRRLSPSLIHSRGMWSHD